MLINVDKILCVCCNRFYCCFLEFIVFVRFKRFYFVLWVLYPLMVLSWLVVAVNGLKSNLLHHLALVCVHWRMCVGVIFVNFS